jgi:hypothetical protein
VLRSHIKLLIKKILTEDRADSGSITTPAAACSEEQGGRASTAGNRMALREGTTTPLGVVVGHHPRKMPAANFISCSDSCTTERSSCTGSCWQHQQLVLPAAADPASCYYPSQFGEEPSFTVSNPINTPSTSMISGLGGVTRNGPFVVPCSYCGNDSCSMKSAGNGALGTGSSGLGVLPSLVMARGATRACNALAMPLLGALFVQSHLPTSMGPSRHAISPLSASVDVPGAGHQGCFNMCKRQGLPLGQGAPPSLPCCSQL